MEDADAAPRFKMRFSIRRFEKVIKSLTQKQRDILVKHGFGMLLNIKHQTVFPLHLIDWMMMNMVPSLAVFKHGNKCINFTKCMVQQFLGIYSGDTAVRMSSDDPDIIAQVKILKEKYMTGTKLTTKKALDLLAGDEDELSFLRSFMLVFLAIIVCPATSDTVDWRYLYSMTDLSTIKSTDWCSLCLQCVLVEAEKFQKRILLLPNGIPNKPLNVGGCLPLLPVTYMDYLDVNANAMEYQIEYGVPRIYHVCTSDFQFVTNIDRVDNPSRVVFGALNFRQHSSTPYCESVVKESMEKESRRYELALRSIGGDSSGRSSREHPITSDPNPAPHIKNLIESIIQSHKVELMRDVEKLVESRFCKMSKSIYSALCEQGLAGAKCAAAEIHANNTEARSDDIVPGTSIVAGKPQDSIQVGSQSDYRNRRSSACAKDKLVGAERTPIPPHGQRRSPRLLRDDPIDEPNIASTQRAALGIQLARSYASDHHTMPVFDLSPIAFDASPSFGSKAADRPVFDNSPLLSMFFFCLFFIFHLLSMPTVLPTENFSMINPGSSSNEIPRITNSSYPRVGCYKRQIICTPSEEELFTMVTSNIDNSFSCRIFQIEERWAAERTLALCMSDCGYVNEYVMDAYVKMILFNQKMNDTNGVKLGFLKHITYSEISEALMFPSLDHNLYKKLFSELGVGFRLEHAGLVHVPCVVTKQWFLVVANFMDKRFDILNPSHNSDTLKHTIDAVIYNFKKLFIDAFPRCQNFNITDFKIRHVKVPKQNFKYDSGIFVLIFMLTFNGFEIPDFSNEDLPALKKKLLFKLVTNYYNTAKVSPRIKKFIQKHVPPYW